MGNSNIDRLIVIGDRVLIEPAVATHKTKGGLLLPAGYQEKEEVQTGYILKVGPGYPLPSSDDSEAWQPSDKEPRYLPLQVGRSPRTVESYRDALTVFRRYLRDERGLSVAGMEFGDCTRDLVLSFVEHLRAAGCSAGAAGC